MKKINKKILIGCSIGVIGVGTLFFVPCVSASASETNTILDHNGGNQPSLVESGDVINQYSICDFLIGEVSYTENFDYTHPDSSGDVSVETALHTSAGCSIPRKLSYFNNTLNTIEEGNGGWTAWNDGSQFFQYQASYPVKSSSISISEIIIADENMNSSDIYMSFSDMYLSSKYSRGRFKFTIGNNFFNAFWNDTTNHFGFSCPITYTRFTLNNDGTLSSEYIQSHIDLSNLLSSFPNNTRECVLDSRLFDILNVDTCYGIYIHSLDIVLKDYNDYNNTINLEVHYSDDSYLYNIFSEVQRFKFEADNFNVSEFLIHSVSSFMDFEIFPNFSFGLLLSMILTIGLLVWIIKVFIGG